MSHILSQKNKSYEPGTQKIDWWLPMGGSGRGLNWEFGISRCKLVYTEWINKKFLLCSTGTYIHYLVINHKGKEYEQYIYVYTKPFVIQQPLTQHCRSTRFSLFSRSVVSDSLQPRGPQHARPPCPSPTPRACSNSCPSSRWCHPTVSSSVVPFSSCPQSLPASGSFPVSQFFPSCGQRIGVSASASVLPMNIQGWFPSALHGLISLQSKGTLDYNLKKKK